MDIISAPRNVVKKATSLPYISVLLKQQRINLGLSQQQLANKIGLGLKTLRKIEQGELNVNFQKLHYLMNLFGMTLIPAELMTSPRKKNHAALERDFIIKMLGHLFGVLKLKYGICELALFGSYAKGQALPESDIDILIDSDYTLELGQEGEIQLILENIFSGFRIDLVFRKNIHQALIQEIEESKINVMEKIQVCTNL